MEREFEKLLSLVHSYNQEANFEKLKSAWEFSKSAHEGQKRLSGDPYVVHPLEVATILASWRMDTDSIVSGLLHDTLEDTNVDSGEILKLFGGDVAKIVQGVTKVTRLRLMGDRKKQTIENLRKMFLGLSHDLRVVLVKLADRLHNMRTIGALSPEKQKENALETLEIYAPLAERLGIGEVKGELEDLSFPCVYPEEYKKIRENSRGYYKEAEKSVFKMKRHLLTKLASLGVRANITGREKHYYSLWKKLGRPEINGDYGKVHDIVALRILLEDIPQCYTALGVVHEAYKPVPGIGISDFIAQPKPNGYRSIHTKVFGPNGKIAEVQIRTREMHEEAEFGVAAHWAYSESKSKGVSDESLEKKGVSVSLSKLSWVKRLVEWQKEIVDSDEFLKAVKFDALGSRIYVFSPKGDVFDLPQGATPVDFAYSVHTSLGNYIQGAKVNGKIVSLSYKIKSGEIVEIMKTKEKRVPARDWLEFVVTQTARKEIRKGLQDERGLR